MQFKSIKYEQLFPTASYLNVRLGVEIELSDTDSVDKALELGKETVTRFHKEQYPQFYTNKPVIYKGEDGEEKVIPTDKIPDNLKVTLAAIRECKDLKELDEYYLLSKGNLILSDEWKKMKAILTNKEKQ